jgi:cobalamin biosynthesis Mg chelatase CobN
LKGTIDTTNSSLELEKKILEWNTVYATCGKIQVENCIAAVHKETKDTATEEKETKTDNGASSPIRKENETTQTTSPSVQGVNASSITTPTTNTTSTKSTTSTTSTTSSICITQEEEYGLSLINIHQILSANVEPMRDKAPLPCGAAYRARKQARLVLHAMFPQMQMRLMEAIVLDTDFNMQAATEVALGMDPRLHSITE